MDDPFAGAIASLQAARLVWVAGGGGSFAGMASGTLVAVGRDLGAARRHVDAVIAQTSAEIARQSGVEFGKDGLARKQGYRSPAALIADATGTGYGDAARFVTVGEATAPRVTLTGQQTPARHRHVAEALSKARIGMQAASVIITRLDKLALRATPTALDDAEAMLVERAPHLTLDQLNTLLTRIEAHLNPDGVAPREDELRTARSLRIREDASGAVSIDGHFDPEGGAFILAAIDAITNGQHRHGRTGRSAAAGLDAAAAQSYTTTSGHRDGCDGRADDCACVPTARPVDDDNRSIAQRRADALVDLCRHTLGCTNAGHGNPTTTVVVRINLKDLENGTGHGMIDGLDHPVSVGTVRRLAASGNIIPCVLGSDSDILDWGRAKRLFTPAQRLALTERDGGCAFCGHPPAYTQAHHIRWWTRDTGPTNLNNGIMLCTRCHHRIHDDSWDIQVTGTGTKAAIHFIPPPWLDPDRTPRPSINTAYSLAA